MTADPARAGERKPPPGNDPGRGVEQEEENVSETKDSQLAVTAEQREWTWERGRGKRGVGKHVYTVTHNPDGFALPRANPHSGIAFEFCYGVVSRQDHRGVIAVWKVVKLRDNRRLTGYYCDECLRPDQRPGSPECEAANQRETYAARRPKLTDEDKLHRRVNKIGGVDGIAEGHYAVTDPHDPERVTTWRVKDGKFESWPARTRVGPVADINWRVDRPQGYRERDRFVRDAWDRQRSYLETVKALIRDNSEQALARFADQSGSCCMCNRHLSDPESVGYGIGPECRRWMPAADRAAIADYTSRHRTEAQLPEAS
jgi:Family of unknown function (DUF6011)